MAVFWIAAPYSLVEVYQRFRGPCYLHHQGDELAMCMESVWDIRTNQPRQKPWPDQWGIGSGSGEAREPTGKRGCAMADLSARKFHHGQTSTWTTASNSRTPPSYPPNLDTWTGWSGRPLRLNYTLTTWWGRMAFAWAGHRSPASTLSKDVGSIWYSIDCPYLATRPLHCPFQDTTWPPAISLFPLSALACYSVQFLPIYFFPCPPHHMPLMCGNPLACPVGPWKGPFPLPLTCCPCPSWSGCGTPPLSYWLPGLAQSRPYSPLVQSRFLPWLTGSYISNRFHACGLLIALMMEAARTSETLVNFYQTTRRYNPEGSHLCTHCHENLKSY
jgi:hypothetical protein